MGNFIKIIGLKFDVLEGLSVVQDANRKSIADAAEFAQERDDNNTIWIVVPCNYCINKV